MKKTALFLAAALAAGSLYAQAQNTPPAPPATASEPYVCGCGDPDFYGYEGPREERRACGPRANRRKAGRSSDISWYETRLRERLARRGMNEADITKMIQLQQEMSALMDKAFDNPAPAKK